MASAFPLYGKETAMTDIRTELETIKKHIPENTYKTIKGQIKAGQEEAARVGIMRIKRRVENAHTCN